MNNLNLLFCFNRYNSPVRNIYQISNMDFNPYQTLRIED